MKLKENSREKIKEIMDIVLDIQELGAHTFMWYSGHANTFEVQVYEHGWSYEIEKEDYDNSFCLSKKFKIGNENIDECIESLKKIREKMRKKELSKKS